MKRSVGSRGQTSILTLKETSCLTSSALIPAQEVLVGENAASRWALLVVRTVDCPVDPRNLMLWGRCVGASIATLRSRCLSIRTGTKISLDFARLVRAIVRSNGLPWDPSVELDVSDPRTLSRLLERGGINHVSEGLVSLPLRQLLSQQRLIHHELALRCVTKAFSDRGLL